MSGSRIFFAGGTGAIGRVTVPLLLQRGHRVTVMTRDPARTAALLPPEVDLVAGDVFDAARTADLMTAAGAELVMHQLTDLTRGDPAANARIRVEGSRNLVDAALAAGVARIVAQSIAWAYEAGDGPAGESRALDVDAPAEGRRTTVRGIRTLEAEVARAGDAVVLRNGVLYGPGTWYRQDGLFGGLARDGLLPATPSVVSFIHVADAARAAVDAITWPAGAYNIVDDEPAAGTAWVPAFARSVGGPAPKVEDQGDPWALGATNTHAKEQGWAPVWTSWRSGFEAAPTSWL
jgi:nucleoside-diphosphate-sugar epimerase